MNTDSNLNGSDHVQGSQTTTDSLTSVHGSGTASAFGEQPGRTQAQGRSAAGVVVWPHFNIGADGRVYA